MHATRSMQHSWAALIATICLILPVSAGLAEDRSLAPAVLELVVNDEATGISAIALRGPDNELWLQEHDIRQLRIDVTRRKAELVDGERYYLVNPLAQSIAIDDAHQRAILTLPAASFLSTKLSAKERRSPSQTTSAWGSFLNYEIAGQHSDADTTKSAFAELGTFGPHGVLTTTAIANDFGNTAYGARLDTTLTHDFPQRMETLRMGDAISVPGNWGSAVRFGGVQWGTNFGMRPDLITAPLLTAGGVAVVPSTVDVYLNNQVVSTQQVPSGPFVIDRLPVITGAGDVRVVVRDALGREQVVTVPFYSGATLLRAGLNQYSLEFGKVRENFALRSWDYGATVLSGTYRRGITDMLTLEGHGEWLHGGAHDAGVNAAIRAGRLGVFGLTAAQGGDSDNDGWSYGASFERSARSLSLVLSTQWLSDGFRQISSANLAALRPKQRSFAQIGIDLHAAGTLTTAYAVERFSNEPQRSVVSLTHNISIGTFGFLSLAITHTRADRDATNAFLTFTVPLSGRRTASAVARYDEQAIEKTNEVVATFQQSPPLGPGLGYRLAASSAGNYDADALMQFEPVAIDVEAARYENSSAQRATLSGAATLLDGELRASRSVTDSFASIDIGGIPNVTVFVENQPVTRTDANGRALLRNLRPYEENRISVEPTELPIETSIEARTISVAPAFRSGVKVRFPVTRERGATFTLTLPNGSFVPAGATVEFKSKQFTVATNGMTYVTGFDHGMSGTASWPQGRCTFRLEPRSSDDPLPDLGTIICRPPDLPTQARVNR